MADTLCGPSNALQNFQKQTSVDRTLQQDRLVNRRVQAENFRSDQARNAGVLDPEFEAFQAGHMPMFEHEPLQQGRNFGGPPLPAAQFAQQPSVSGWAADFQKLHISQAPVQQATPLRVGGNVGWHQEFQRQQQQAPVMSQSQTFAPQFASMGLQRPMGYMPSSSYQQPSTESQWKGKENWPMESEVDQAAFDKEFELFASEALQREAEETESKSAEIGQDVQLGNETKQINTDHMEVLEQIREEVEPLISQEPEQLPQPDDILEEPTEQVLDEPIDDDGLAEPAGRLLEHVADNNTEKFQNSQFLDLMRRLRDRETVLKGEEFVDTHRASHTQQLSPPSASANTYTDHNRPSTIIPPEQQDSDLGRDARMTGALPPMDELGWSEKERPLPLDPSFRHRHLVDDF